MATYILNPNEDHAADVFTGWTVYPPGTDIFDILDDNSGNYIYSDIGLIGMDFRVGFETFTLGAGETIDSVQCCFDALTGNTRSETAVMRIRLEDSSNSDYFIDAHTVTTNGGNPATYCGTATTTSDGSTAWVQGDIDTIRMDVQVYSLSGGSPSHNVVITQAYIVVETTIPVVSAPTYTSDDNLILKNGTLVLKEGLTIIK
jgi:hypothetical protein